MTGSRRIDWVGQQGCPKGLSTREVHLGRSDATGMSLEVAVARWEQQEPPSRDALAKLHRLRVAQRATPVVLVVEIPGGSVIIFGPGADAAPVGPLPGDRAQRIIQASLDESSVVAARARLAGLVQALDSTAMPGVKNSGLFANHELRAGVPKRPDWEDSCRAAMPLLGLRGRDLVSRLGFTVGQAGAHAMVLTGSGPRPEAIAVMLYDGEAFDADSQRFAVSPVAYGLKMAEQQGVPWLVMLRGSQIRLYPARIEFGVGRKGLSETFFEVDLPQLTDANAGYLSLVFSAAALGEGGTTYEILKSSTQYAVELGARLRDKVYEEIVPELAVAVSDALVEQGHEMDPEGLDLAYQLTLRVFFRMLFQVYAEDRKLLPYGENAKYDRNAIKTVAKDLVEEPDQEFDPESTSLWDDLAQVWKVIDSGDAAWGVPPYNGGLFSSDKELHPHGALLKTIQIPNDVMGPVLRALLLDETDDGTVGPIDFRSLSVREFGTIYEGLLESSLGIADVDLTLDDKGAWVPAKKNDEVWAAAGDVYFHHTSGMRKDTGSYFTPTFVVEHLLERSLDPAIDRHLAEVAAMVEAGDQAGAAEKFFDFRVVDLAMGSGHFLTAAIDHIEAKMAAFLADGRHAVPGVAAMLQALEAAARKAIGPDAPEPETSSLLRRQIARRCVYGLDINPISVELARVSIWIHTFVRGLPMSSLDHNLVCANSLTGIGSVDEALDALVPGRSGALTLFDGPIEDALASARSVLLDVARMPEVDRAESQAAARAIRDARREAAVARSLFDAAVLTRIGDEDLVAASEVDTMAKMAARPRAQEALAPLQPGHMPALFPDVFLRDRGGFDVVLGNPPWEKVKVEEHQWWGLRFPGLRSMPMAQRTKEIARLQRSRPDLVAEYETAVEATDRFREVLSAGPFPGIGSGDIDLYKAFAWRMWQLCRQGGAVGVVLPRSALSGSGTQQWRREILSGGEFANVVVTVNTGKWVFESIHGQYSTAFVVLRKGEVPGGSTVAFAGPFHTKDDFLARRDDLAVVPADEFTSWTGTAAFPLIPDRKSGEIFRQMRSVPAFRDTTGFEFRPAAELHATQDSRHFSTSLDAPVSEIPVLTGSSFNLWEPDFGDPYGWAKTTAIPHVLAKTTNSARQANSAFRELGIETPNDLPMARPRIAFRDITRATDSRTMVCCLVPPDALLVHPAPYLVRRMGDEADEAFVLGVFSSRIFDWYARRLVELHMTFELLERFPVPRPAPSDPLRQTVIDSAGRLAARDSRYATWAKKVGVPVGSVSPADRTDLEAQLDAAVARLYGLSRDQVAHVHATFHKGWDYSSHLEAVLAHFDRLGASRG